MRATTNHSRNSTFADLNRIPKHEFQRLPEFELVGGDGEVFSRFRAEDKTQATQLANEWLADNQVKLGHWKVRPVGPPSHARAVNGFAGTIRKSLPDGNEVIVLRTNREEAATP